MRQALPGRTFQGTNGLSSDDDDTRDFLVAHKKRLGGILQYLSMINQSDQKSSSACSSPFIRMVTSRDFFDAGKNRWGSDADFEALHVRGWRTNGTAGVATASTQDGTDVLEAEFPGGENVVLSMEDFRRIDEICGRIASGSGGDRSNSLAAACAPVIFSSPPYSFYSSEGEGVCGVRSSTSTAGKKRMASKISGAVSGDVSGLEHFWKSWPTSFSSQPEVSNDTRNSRNNRNKPCWFRLTRLLPEPPPSQTEAVQEYVTRWANDLRTTPKRVLARHALASHPPVPPTPQTRERDEIRSFLRRHRKYARRDAVRKILERSYRILFELAQSQNSSSSGQMSATGTFSSSIGREVLWGFGTAYCLIRRRECDMYTIVEGPLLEVRVEVDLATDGAILVRPCEHIGVALNLEIVSTLLGGEASCSKSSADVIAKLQRYASEIDPAEITPGQPVTYRAILKRMTVDLQSAGKFVEFGKDDNGVRSEFMSRFRHTSGYGGESSSNSPLSSFASSALVVDDSWCLFHRPKPCSVLARDAQAMGDRLLAMHDDALLDAVPRATISLTIGPEALCSLKNTEAKAKVVEFSSSTTSTSSTSMLCSLRLFFGMQKQKVNAGDPQARSFPKSVSGNNSASAFTGISRLLFPLPSSQSQNRIAELLGEGAPAVVVVGPPGCGKTHSIANIVCSYLANGKRVLVTSKGAPALSVLRSRLPPSVRGLCVDVSMSESSGMQHLQRAVEILADRVAAGVAEADMCCCLRKTIDDLEMEVCRIDDDLASMSKAQRTLMELPGVHELVQELLSLEEDAPWLVSSLSNWSSSEFDSFLGTVKSLAGKEVHGGYDDTAARCRDLGPCVTGYPFPPPDELISLVASKAGVVSSAFANTAIRAIATMPLIGELSGARDRVSKITACLNELRIDGSAPSTSSDWRAVHGHLTHEKEILFFHENTLKPLIDRDGWPEDIISGFGTGRRGYIKDDMVHLIQRATAAREKITRMELQRRADDAERIQYMESRRRSITSRLLALYERLVEANVVSRMNEAFSPTAQSALIRFAQLSGKAKFRRSTKTSKMSQRQQRHRQQYLKAFEECVRYIPCWVLTTTQVSDYLPPDFDLFDLVVIDEASQSDITVLPSMLRGTQWLIVGDGKQVSPTESFLSEEHIENLQLVLPESPFQDSLLPGQSFFDLCSQAFPSERVVLTEHFRCAPEIIHYCNDHFYNGKLNPLRMPTSLERMTPSVVDVFVQSGRKIGKVNEAECDVIVSMVTKLVFSRSSSVKCKEKLDDLHVHVSVKSIGIVSLIGDEQSRLIRGRLLDAIGPEKYKRHSILVGDPPTFQGAERDVIFLSMVASPRCAPTQSQQMHAQRANVALSRAKDRMVLVRSLNHGDISSQHDVKFAILHFFSKYGTALLNSGVKDASEQSLGSDESSCDDGIADAYGGGRHDSNPIKTFMTKLFIRRLEASGFSVREMGTVWEGSFCVENTDTDGKRLAISFENCGESKREWDDLILQQRSIERVGWKCVRMNALHFITEPGIEFKRLERILRAEGIERTKWTDTERYGEHVARKCMEDEVLEGRDIGSRDDMSLDTTNNGADEGEEDAATVQHDGIVVVSSDEEATVPLSFNTDTERSDAFVKEEKNHCPEHYGDVIDVAFANPSNRNQSVAGKGREDGTDISLSDFSFGEMRKEGMGSTRRKSVRRRSSKDRVQGTTLTKTHSEYNVHRANAQNFEAGLFNSGGGDSRDATIPHSTRKRRRRYRKRLDSYSRDGRWYPPKKSIDHDDDDDDDNWCDEDDTKGGDSSPYYVKSDPEETLGHVGQEISILKSGAERNQSEISLSPLIDLSKRNNDPKPLAVQKEDKEQMPAHSSKTPA